MAAVSGGENRLVSLPLSRIRVIMKSSPEVSSINQDALFLTAKATISCQRKS
uniref:Transcription factor CBF/NF-Y/archaeal histone domain-containing protein n=2 Tax=Phasianinae TaxID=9072 RepID=A0A8C3LIQ4_CHRPC